MVFRCLLPFAATAFVAFTLAGCAQADGNSVMATRLPTGFSLTEESAMDRLMATRHVAELVREIPNRHLMCMVDYDTPEAIYLYLGDDEGDHTTRIGFYRVCKDGGMQVNQDKTGLENRYVTLQ